MNAQPHTPTQADTRYLALLDELIEGAADLARRVLAESRVAPTPENPAPATHATIPYERVARTLRRTATLAHHLAHNTLARPAQPAPATEATRANNRERVLRGVEDAIHRTRREPGAESLYAELNERLDDPDFDHDLGTRPIQDLVDELTRDLGVAVQLGGLSWKRRTPQDIRDLRTRAGNPARNTTPRPTPTNPEPPPGLHLVRPTTAPTTAPATPPAPGRPTTR